MSGDKNISCFPSWQELIMIIGVNRISPYGKSEKKKKEIVAPVSPVAQDGYSESKRYRIVEIHPKDGNYWRRSEMIGLTGAVKNVCYALRFYPDNGQKILGGDSLFLLHPKLEEIGE